LRKEMGGKKEAMEVMPLPQGPVKNRSCTDILCLLLFVFCIAGWAGVSYIGFRDGNPELLIYPTNSTGQICGQGENAERPFLFFQNLLVCASMSSLVNGCPTPQVCVEECPKHTTSLYAYAMAKTHAGGLPIDFPDFDLEFQRNLCVPSMADAEWDIAVADSSGDPLINLINERKCPAYTIESIGIAGRCVPDFGLIQDKTDNSTSMKDDNGNDIVQGEGDEGIVDVGDVLDSIKSIADILNLQQIAEKIFSDLVKAWRMLLAGVGISVAISFFWIFLMRFIAGVMIWLSLALTIALLAVSSVFTWMKYDELEGVPAANGSLWNVNPMYQEWDVYLQLRDTWLVLFIISVSLCAIIVLITIFLRNRLRIAIALISEASKAVGSIMSSVFFPIFSFLLQLVVMVWWFVVCTFLASSMDKQFTMQSLNSTCSDPRVNEVCKVDDPMIPEPGCECMFTGLTRNPMANYLQIYNVFMLFWGMCFVSALGEMVLAGAFSSWYWTFDKSDVPALPVLRSIGRTFRYHTGTLAFGSLIIAIIKMIRLMLQYIQDKLEEKGADNPVVKAILCLCKCCFWCLEKFMKFINRNAYILTASQGSNFCKSAKQAFGLIFRNMVRVAVLDKVTDFLLFLGKLVVTAAVALLSFFYFSGGINTSEIPTPMRSPDLNYYFIPVFFLAFVTYFIAACFFSVYAMAVDTLFLCFLVDSEKNDGSAEKPYYMSPGLMKILSVKNQAKYAK
jgi:choline transporter-like protein 2/4/5